MGELAYNVFYKRELPIDQAWLQKWDIFISAYNSSERVRGVYDRVSADRKYWIIHNEYAYQPGELPAGQCFTSELPDEGAYVTELISQIEADCGRSITQMSVCIDITGFMRPHLLVLTLLLSLRGAKKFDALYSEPQRYAKKENTQFSEGAIAVRQVNGFAGLNSTSNTGDFLIIGAGYDDRLIRAVANEKDKADKVQIFGLPSLRADMYQENVLKADLASDAIGYNKGFPKTHYFSPANDPFVTASTLNEIVSERKTFGPIANLYISPLATKPQALGFALFYINECQGSCSSILFSYLEQLFEGDHYWAAARLAVHH